MKTGHEVDWIPPFHAIIARVAAETGLSREKISYHICKGVILRTDWDKAPSEVSEDVKNANYKPEKYEIREIKA